MLEARRLEVVELDIRPAGCGTPDDRSVRAVGARNSACWSNPSKQAARQVPRTTGSPARCCGCHSPSGICRNGGVVCGQALTALADSAMVVACSAAWNGYRPMTPIDQTMHFLRPVNFDVVADARVVRIGRPPASAASCSTAPTTSGRRHGGLRLRDGLTAPSLTCRSPHGAAPRTQPRSKMLVRGQPAFPSARPPSKLAPARSGGV